MANDSTDSEIKWETLIQCISYKDLYQTVKYVIKYTPDSSGVEAINYLNSVIHHNGKSPYKDELLMWINEPKLSYLERLDKLNQLQRQYDLYIARKDKASSCASQNQTSQKNYFDKTAFANVTPIQTGPENKEDDKAIKPSVATESKNEKPQEKKPNKAALYDVNLQSVNTDKNKSNSLLSSTKPKIPLQDTRVVNKPLIQSKHVKSSSANDSSKTPVLSVQNAAKIGERKAACSDSGASAKPTQENTSSFDAAEKNSVKANKGVPIFAIPLSKSNQNLEIAQGENKFLKQANKDAPIIAKSSISRLNKPQPSIPEQAQAEKTVPNKPNNAAEPKGKANRTKKEYNILLFGETGVGKSTFINGFHNYITYKTFKEALKNGPKVTVPFQLEINGQLHTFGENMQGNENFNQSAQSVTQNPKCYTVEDTDVCYNFIDTPGLSDTRGIAYDRKNSDKIMEFLKSFEKEIHAICILFKADKSKVTTEFTNALGNLSKIYTNVANNIFFWFTHCQNGYGASLNTVKEWLKQSEAKFTIDGQNCFQIQNNCINQLWSQKINPDDPSAKGKFPEIIQNFWEDNIKEIEKFKGILLKKQVISLKEPIELFQLKKDYLEAAGDTVAAISECADWSTKRMTTAAEVEVTVAEVCEVRGQVLEAQELLAVAVSAADVLPQCPKGTVFNAETVYITGRGQIVIETTAASKAETIFSPPELVRGENEPSAAAVYCMGAVMRACGAEEANDVDLLSLVNILTNAMVGTRPTAHLMGQMAQNQLQGRDAQTILLRLYEEVMGDEE